MVKFDPLLGQLRTTDSSQSVNTITASTTTDLNGVLKGNGANVSGSATTADLPDSVDKRYVTDAELSTISSLTNPTNYEKVLYFGDGSDGDVTISGAVTLTRDMNYHNLTLSAGAALNPANYHIRVSGTLDISAAPAGAILATGFDANAPTGTNESTAATGNGASDAASYWMPANQRVAGAGINGASTAGSATAGSSTGSMVVNNVTGQGGYAGGGGTAAGGNAGETGRLSGLTQAIQTLRSFFNAFPFLVSPSFNGSISSNGGRGTGDGSNTGGAGGGRGGAGGVVWLAANIIARGSNSTAGIINNGGGKGGRGGNPSTGVCGGGGGAGGGAGGYVYLLYGSLTGSTITNAITSNGGDGGTGGTGVGGAGNGHGGGGGDGGIIFTCQLGSTSAGTITIGTTGGNGSGTTAGTGGTCQANL